MISDIRLAFQTILPNYRIFHDPPNAVNSSDLPFLWIRLQKVNCALRGFSTKWTFSWSIMGIVHPVAQKLRADHRQNIEQILEDVLQKLMNDVTLQNTVDHIEFCQSTGLSVWNIADVEYMGFQIELEAIKK